MAYEEIGTVTSVAVKMNGSTKGTVTSSGTIDLGTVITPSGGTMTGALVAQNNTNYTTKQVRNIFLSTTVPTAADGANGDIWIVYTA